MAENTKKMYDEIQEQIARIYENMRQGEMSYCMELEHIVRKFVEKHEGACEFTFQYNILYTIIYQMGVENGKREERERRNNPDNLDDLF